MHTHYRRLIELQHKLLSQMMWCGVSPMRRIFPLRFVCLLDFSRIAEKTSVPISMKLGGRVQRSVGPERTESGSESLNGSFINLARYGIRSWRKSALDHAMRLKIQQKCSTVTKQPVQKYDGFSGNISGCIKWLQLHICVQKSRLLSLVLLVSIYYLIMDVNENKYITIMCFKQIKTEGTLQELFARIFPFLWVRYEACGIKKV